MISNLEKYKMDLDKLIKMGNELQVTLWLEFAPEQLNNKNLESLKKEGLPSFKLNYQIWYSEVLALLKQLLPDRVEDFIDLYRKTKRKEITAENYTIGDALQGLNVTIGYENKKIVGVDAAIPRFTQQQSILESAKRRFESSLFDIKQLVQADLFDSELEAAKELNKKGFTRSAGAVAGVVLEGHLLQVCNNHKINITKKNPAINDFAQLLKDNSVIEIPDWRKIQQLADLRNLCNHKKTKDPTNEEIKELIIGVSKLIKTLF
jgi:hypothetical protein